MTPAPIHLPAEPRAAGHAHGQACGAEIRAFLADGLARVNALRPRPLTRAAALALAAQHGEVLARELPDATAELRGLAEGAEISYGEALLLQYRREIISAEVAEAHGCSLGVMRMEGGAPLLGQTIDLEGDVGSLVRLFRIAGDATRPRVLMLSLAGLTGYLGMNDRGVCVGINMVLGGEWQAGVSPYLLVRHLLLQDTLDDCVRELRRVRRASSRTLTLMQGARSLCVEMTPQELHVRETPQPFHTNHFLDEGLARRDRLNVFSRNSSVKRLGILTAALADKPVASVEEVFAVFSDHSLYPVGVCMHANGIVSRAETIAAVVMQPTEGVMHVRFGPPCAGATSSYSF